MKKYEISVLGMSAIYHIEFEGLDKEDAIKRLRDYWKRRGDSRYNWEMIAHEIR